MISDTPDNGGGTKCRNVVRFSGDYRGWKPSTVYSD